MALSVLVDRLGGRSGAAHLADLPALYAAPSSSWLRANMVATLDGAVAGADGRSGSINTAVDRVVFRALRALADAVVVGAGTARAERYGATTVPLVVVSRRGEVPERLKEAPAGSVLLATTRSAPGLAAARDLLGHDGVLELGEDGVDPRALRAVLAERGLRQLLCEGGPTLLGDLLAAGVVDELCQTWVPLLVGGGQGRTVTGHDLDVGLELAVLLEEEGTLLGRWLVR